MYTPWAIKWQPEKKILVYDFDKEECIKELQSNSLEDFTAEIACVGVLRAYTYDDSPSGECIKIIFDDKSYIIISPTVKTVFRYSCDGIPTEYIGIIDKKVINDLIAKYFPE